MSTLRSARPLIGRRYLFLQPRKFHAAPSIKARPVSKQSPRVRAANHAPGSARVKRTYDHEESLPPITLLEAARKSGALDVEPDEALHFLREYQALAVKSNTGWEQRLCNEHNISPSNLALLAGILKRCKNAGQQALAKSVMLAASRLGEKAATFDIVSEALRVGTLYEYRGPLERLSILAKKDSDPQAMTLLGKVLVAEKHENEALDWFRRATRPPTGSLEFDGAGEALVSEGRILAQRNDRVGAKVAFEKAALELDEPSAYFYLAKLEEPGSSNQQVYLLKAASSGVVEAWHNLGVIELEKLKFEDKAPTSLDDFGMAREWFQVAAAEGFGLSMLNLATMYRSIGQMDDALKWLERAKSAEGTATEATTLQRQWVASASEV